MLRGAANELALLTCLIGKGGTAVLIFGKYESGLEPRIAAVVLRLADIAKHALKGTTLTFRVEELEPTRHVAWSSVQVSPDWEGTQVPFGITPGDGTVNLKFSHTGFAFADGSFGVTSHSWAQYLRSIKLLLETGEGEPFGSRGSRLAGTTR